MKKARPTLGAICKKHGITRNTLAAWQSEGVDIYSDTAMAARASVKHGAAHGEDMKTARLRKLRAEASAAELKVAELEKTMISIAEVSQAFTAASAAVRAGIMRLCADLPIQLEGLSAAKMQSIIRDHCTRILRELSDEKSEPWK